jgi:hypothetical protein
MHVTDLMDVPAGDEVGVPDEEIEHCETHDVLYHERDECLRCAEAI